MKRHIYSILIILLFLSSCNNLDFNAPISSSAQNSTSTKFNVSLKSVNTLLGILGKNDSTSQIDNVEPIVYSGDTLLYIINYKNNAGWKIISGDKRTSSILASDKSGAFKLNDVNPSVATWFDDIAEHVYALKKQGESDTTGADYALWTNIEKLQTIHNRVNGPSKIAAPIADQGYWELENITSTTLPSTQVGPLLTTKWGQSSPWNTCVPYNRAFTSRCLTGCVAVAGSQTLYYLHNKIGVPVNAYGNGSCVGYSESGSDYNFSFSFSNPSPTVWNNMDLISQYDYTTGNYLNTTGTKNVATLMGFIGSSIQMSYSTTASGASQGNLNSFINNNGISCSLQDYNSATVFSSLNNYIPVISIAYATRVNNTFLGIHLSYSYKDGHAWVIDGYETQYIKYTYYYQWIATSGGGIQMQAKSLVPQTTFKTEESILGTSYLIMNWGWDGYCDSGRYSYSGDWSGGGYNFLYQRQMISGFAKK